MMTGTKCRANFDPMSLTLGGRDISYSELSDEADKYNYKPENRIFQFLLVEATSFLCSRLNAGYFEL